MFFQSIVVAFLAVLEVNAVSHDYSGALKKRVIPSTHSLHERHLPHWSQRWTKRSKVPDNQILPMRIGLKQQNLEAGHDKLMDISTPGSESYGKHMTSEEVVEFFAPHSSTTDTVLNWLTASGISANRSAVSANKQWIQFDATAAEVEDLFFAEFFVWEHIDSGNHDISTEEYHIPTHIQEHVDYVTPGTRLRQRNVKGSKFERSLEKRNGLKPQVTQLPGFPHPNSSTCDTYVTAECTRVQYSIPNATTAAPGNEIGIFETIDVHYSRADLDVFFSTLYPHIPNGTYPEERLIDGAIGATEDTTEFVPIALESGLDFDSSWPLIYPQGLVLFQEDDEVYESGVIPANGLWNTFLDAIDGSYCTYSAFGETGDCNVTACQDPVYPDPNPGGYNGSLQCGVYEPTNVISISYADAEFALPDYYVKRQCNEWMKLALQGTTIVMSAGDDGVGAGGLSCLGPKVDIFEPLYASTCPYVLSVGSTEWDAFDNGTKTPGQPLKEVSTERFSSGGGFSNVFPVPSYQEDAVASYLNTTGPSLGFESYSDFIENGNFANITSGVFHAGGRAYPDVSAVGDRQVVYSNGSWWLVGGTSLAAPVWGAILTLVNEERIAANKSTVGFIHPILYAHPEIFTDITNGSNPGCGSSGFLAAEGWDPVSGLGSPNFPVLLDVLMNA